MAQTQLATRTDDRVKKAVEEVWNARGLKMNRFIEDALIDKPEELEVIEDLIKIRRLQGYDDVYRVRTGVYRIIYSIEDRRLLIIMLKIGQRKDVYR